jgi:hypothetical protein
VMLHGWLEAVSPCKGMSVAAQPAGHAKGWSSVTRKYAALAQLQLPQRHSCCRQRSHPAAVGTLVPATCSSSSSCRMTGTRAPT